MLNVRWILLLSLAACTGEGLDVDVDVTEGTQTDPEPVWLAFDHNGTDVCGIRATDHSVDCTRLTGVRSDIDQGILNSPPGLRVRSITVALYYACAVSVDQTLVCWGHQDEAAQTEVIDRVPDIQDAIQVSANAYGVCAVRQTGDLVCWGRDSGLFPDYETVTRAPVGGSWKEVIVGTGQCAQAQDSSLTCWGEGGSDAPMYNLVARTPKGAWSDFDVASGAACALDLAGEGFVCWGDPEWGAMPPDVPQPTRPWVSLHLAGVGGPLCGIDADGLAECVRGEFDPWQALNPDPAIAWTDLDMGYNRSCGIDRDGPIRCWGTQEELYEQTIY